MTAFLALPESRDPHSLAEWIEIVMLLEELSDFSTAEILAYFPSGQRPPIQDVEVALDLIEERSECAPSVYPFRRSADRVLIAGHPDTDAGAVDLCTYAFLRIVCLQNAPWVRAGRAADIGALFDYIVRDAMLSWMGEGSLAVIFGWPPREGRPGGFIDAVSWLAERVGLPDGDLDRPADANDGGVDCVVWKPSADQRTGFPIWLVQASAEHDVVGKASETIPIEGWKRWIRFRAGPTTVFATAHSVPKGSTSWMQLNDAAVQVADRQRLIELLEVKGADRMRAGWPDELCEFVGEEMVRIRQPDADRGVARVRRRKRERPSEHADPRAR